MKCPRCQHENPPQAKFCIECAAPLARTCANCGTRLPATAKFCPECAHPAGTAAVDSRFAAPEAYTPKHLAEKILTSKSALEGERKQVTVLFADLKGSMELLADRDPEEARKLLDPVLERLMEAVHRYEGTVNQVMGDGIMALFGAPLAHEDHAVRACYAALAMQSAICRYTEEVRRAHGLELQIRVGLNSGEVVVRAIGSDLHMDYTAVGQTTHLAARMEQLATPGTIRLTAETLRLAEGFVQVKSLGLVPVKGLAEPVEIFDLAGAAPTRSRMEAAAARGLTRFVGRESELDQLRQALEKARAGHGQVVALVGEPGVGKSRLFWEFTRSHRTHGWLILESGSVSHGKATAYLPILDLLKGYFKIETADDTRSIREKVTGKVLTLDRTIEETIPAILALLDALPEDSPFRMLDPPQRKQRTLDAIKRLLLRESQVQPLLLLFEDLHWIDSETQAVLDSLTESLPTARVLLLGNYRPEYQHGWGSKTYYAQLRLDPLPTESCEELLHALVGDGESLQPLKRLLIERTEGNPFFLEESVRTLVEIQVLVGERRAYRLAKAFPTIQVPATVQAVLAARIDRLPPEEKCLLQSAAVIGKDVPFALLQAIAEVPEEELRRGLAHLQAGEFLYEASLFPELEYTFKHALTHQVAYGGLLHERTKVLHAKVVEAFERLWGERRVEQAEALARHALRGEIWGKAVDYLRETGSKALGRGALQESLERYEQAFELLSRLPTSPENIRRAIDVRSSFYRPLFLFGQLPRLIQLLQEAEQFARQLNDQPRLARVSMTMGLCLMTIARYPEGIKYAQQALSIATAISDPEVRVRSTGALAFGYFGLGDIRAAVDLYTRTVEGPDADLAKRVVAVFASAYISNCSFLALCYAMIGDFERAVHYGDWAVQAADGSDVPQAQAFAYFYRAVPLVLKGEFAQGLPWLERAVNLCEVNGLLYLLSVASILWGLALAWSGRPAEGLPSLERGVTFQEDMGIKYFVSFSYVLWAEGLLLGGQIQEAKRVADRALELARASGERGSEVWGLSLLGEIAAVGDPPDLDSAFTSYELAKALAEELGMRPLLARCHLGLGQLYGKTGKRPQAVEHLTTAAMMLREMGMRFLLEQTERELAQGANVKNLNR